ncbi:antitoxin VbhA family protein [Candidatus Allofournierella merdavium]|uniref:antitoxin VbhA family protein n=1 Tax=Candidatus Allofournierella merdavium TaxID=2838593 RepID=UPI00374F3E76
MAPVTKEEALKNALVSSAMEGFSVSPEVVRNCRRLLNGEVDVDTLVKELLEQKQ